MKKPHKLHGIRMITVSGRIASGSTTLAKKLAAELNWRHVEGGEIFWEAVRAKHKLESKDTNLRPDIEDKEFDDYLKKVLKNEENIVLETKLAGFNAQRIEGIFKILVICDNQQNEDQASIRIDRLINREKINVKKAKEEVIEREKNDLEKWRRMYANGDENWVYWEKKYYDLVINTFNQNQEEALKVTLNAIGL